MEQQAAQVLQQKAEILDKVRHRFRRAIENEDDEPEQEAAVAGALEDGKQQVILHPCKEWRQSIWDVNLSCRMCGSSHDPRE